MAAELPCLVLAPASLLVNWAREVCDWRPKEWSGFHVRSYADPKLAALDPSAYRTVICDEATYIKSPEAKRSMIACRLLARAQRAIAITGTLVPNRPIELWPLLYSMRITDLSFTDFAFRFCAARPDDFAPNGLWVNGASRLPELRELLAPHVVRFTKEQVLPELPPKQWRVLALDLPIGSQEKAMDLSEISRMEEVPAFEAMSTILREHGAAKLPLAIQHVLDLLNGGEEKVVVFAHHRDVVLGMVEALAGNEFSAVGVLGGMTRRAQQGAVDEFQTSPETRVLVGQITAAGVGHTLTAARRVVFAEGSWVPGVLYQAADRCHRIGQAGHVMVDMLTVHKSIDEHMIRRALEKVDVIERIVPITEAPPSQWEGLLR